MSWDKLGKLGQVGMSWEKLGQVGTLVGYSKFSRPYHSSLYSIKRLLHNYFNKGEVKK